MGEGYIGTFTRERPRSGCKKLRRIHDDEPRATGNKDDVRQAKADDSVSKASRARPTVEYDVRTSTERQTVWGPFYAMDRLGFQWEDVGRKSSAEAGGFAMGHGVQGCGSSERWPRLFDLNSVQYATLACLVASGCAPWWIHCPTFPR